MKVTVGKVAIIGTRGYPSFYGGFETLIRRLAPTLSGLGWSVSVYGRPSAISTVCGSDEHRDVQSVITPGFESRSLSTLSYGLTASVHAAVVKPDVALIMNVANGFWLPLLKARGIPTVVNVDGIEWEREKWGTNAKRMFRLGARLTARFADVIVCDSMEISRRWKDEFGRDSVFIPYGGADPGELPADPDFTSGSYAIMVARFVPENTVAAFVEAAVDISNKYDVVIVGSSGYGGELEERVAELCAQHERIHWLGHISDDRRLFALWQHAGAYFHGHSVGGTNPALVQAMACGAPTVARDTVYNREVLHDSAVFTAPTSEAIARSVLGVLGDVELQASLRRSAMRRARCEYGWDAVHSSYHETILTASKKIRHKVGRR